MRLRIDPFIVALVAVAAIASLAPAGGSLLDALSSGSTLAIAALFFSYGVRLPTRDVLTALTHWRLHAVILGTTFVLFPLLGVAASHLPGLAPQVATGILVLTLVPSTIQSSVAFTSMAGGNVPAAVVSASLSSMVGVLATPLLVGLLVAGHGAHVDSGAVVSIALVLLAPFVAGQALRPVLKDVASDHERALKAYERATIMLVVYVAFSKGSAHHIWAALDAQNLVLIVGICAALFCLALGWTWLVGRPFARADRAAIVFCGTHKSLAAGLPMMTLMFSDAHVALVILPLMLYHQLQLIACAWLASSRHTW